MNHFNLAQEIDINRLYDHIYNLQGVRHAIVAPKALEDAADYIKSEFEKLEIEVKEEQFEVEGFDGSFRNIIGKLDLSDESVGEVIISGHHDTVYNTPGANDNASACAVVLEVARVISEHRDSLSGNYRFVSFDLEESNPAFENYLWELGEKYGVRIRNLFTKFSYRNNYEALFPLLRQCRTEVGREKFSSKLSELELAENEKEYYNSLSAFFSDIYKEEEWVGNTFVLGSSYYVSQAKLQGRKIKGLINLDVIGYTSQQKNSQRYPAGFPVRLLKLVTKPILKSLPFFSKSFKTIGVKDITVGDFASLLVDVNSTQYADLFFKSSKLVNLKVTGIYTGMDFFTLRDKMLDLLLSDHAPFWRDGIPAIFISDSAHMRYPYYHTEADTIDKLDFEYIEKIAQASLLTLIAMND
jgi:hypothetical protein